MIGNSADANGCKSPINVSAGKARDKRFGTFPAVLVMLSPFVWLDLWLHIFPRMSLLLIRSSIVRYGERHGSEGY